MRAKHLDVLIRIINRGGIPLICVYVFCMYFYPVYAEGWNWNQVQKVWDRWQTINAGVFAFVASVVAFNIAKYDSNRQRLHRFVAARAFLPHALSDLTTYCKVSSSLLREAWSYLDRDPESHPVGLSLPVPDIPSEVKETFSRCIENAELDIGEYLAYFLMRLQVHHSRLRDLHSSIVAASRTVVVHENLRTYIYRLGELQALINRLFEFARGLKPFDGSPIQWDELVNAYHNLEIWIDEIEDLDGFSRRALEREAARLAK